MKSLAPALQAAIWMSGAVISFTSMAIAGREVSVRLDTFELMTWRSLIGLVIVAGILTARRRWSVIRTRHLGAHVVRNIAHFTGQNLWFYAVTVIPFAQLFALEFSTPLWVALAAPFLLGERLSGRRLATVLVGFVGILMVARPGAVPITPGIAAAAACAIAFAATAIATKRLTRSEPTLAIMFWITAIQLVLGLATTLWDGHITAPDLLSLPWVIIVALGGLVAHTCITSAMQIAPAVIVTPMDFARLPIVALVGMAFYGEPLDMWVILGALVIFGANWLNIRAEARLRPAAG